MSTTSQVIDSCLEVAHKTPLNVENRLGESLRCFKIKKGFVVSRSSLRLEKT